MEEKQLKLDGTTEFEGPLVVSVTDSKGEVVYRKEVDSLPAELVEWWISTATDDLLSAVPKAHEYGGSQGGSADLRLIGANLAELTQREGVPSAILQEMGVWFYVQGKVARLISNYQHGEPGKADTWLDTSIYSMMARRLQATGQWP